MLNTSGQVREVVEYVENAPLDAGSDDRNRGVARGKEKIFLQSQHLSYIRVNYATMCKDQYAFTNMLVRDSVDSCDDALAKCTRGFAVRNRVPVARTRGQTNDLR